MKKISPFGVFEEGSKVKVLSFLSNQELKK